MTTLAADIGGTSVKLGLVAGGRVVARERLPVAERSCLAPLLEPMAARWRAMLDRAGLSIGEGDAVSLAFPGIVDAHGRRVVSTNAKFTDAPSLDLPGWSRDTFGLPLWIENDARAALIGEWHAGAGRGVSDLVMITLGTGIGAAAVIDGRVIRGRRGTAGILGGHLAVDRHGQRCTCGNIGCAEAEASTDRLPQLIARLAQEHALGAAWAADAPVDYARVFAKAKDGDPLASVVRDHSVAVWAALAVNLIHAYAPQRLVIGGGVALGSPWIIEQIEQHAARHAWTPGGAVEVRLAALGDDAALQGCGFLREALGEVVPCR